MNKFSKISIVLKPSIIDDLDNTITHLVRWFKRRKISLHFQEKEAQRFKDNVNKKTYDQVLFESDHFIFKKSDLIISLGGDGTLIGVCRKTSLGIPIMGVNMGRLGFITEFSKIEFYEKLSSILANKFEINHQNVYTIKVFNSDNQLIKKAKFFNDVVFSKNDIARMFTLSLHSDNQHVYNLTGDGLIISSTVGSTAYSLAAGGPLVHPGVKAIILTPICPHSLTHRPLVISDMTKLKVAIADNSDSVVLTIDGQEAIDLKPNQIVTISKNKSKNIKLIKNKDREYFLTLKEKLVHGRRDA